MLARRGSYPDFVLFLQLDPYDRVLLRLRRLWIPSTGTLGLGNVRHTRWGRGPPSATIAAELAAAATLAAHHLKPTAQALGPWLAAQPRPHVAALCAPHSPPPTIHFPPRPNFLQL